MLFVGFMEHSGVNPSAAGGCKVEDPLGPLTRSQVDVTELCQRIPEGNSRLAPSVPDSVKSTCYEKENSKCDKYCCFKCCINDDRNRKNNSNNNGGCCCFCCCCDGGGGGGGDSCEGGCDD